MLSPLLFDLWYQPGCLLRLLIWHICKKQILLRYDILKLYKSVTISVSSTHVLFLILALHNFWCITTRNFFIFASTSPVRCTIFLEFKTFVRNSNVCFSIIKMEFNAFRYWVIPWSKLMLFMLLPRKVKATAKQPFNNNTQNVSITTNNQLQDSIKAYKRILHICNYKNK